MKRIAFLLIVFFSCTKQDGQPASLSVVTTAEVTTITAAAAVSGGSISSDGGKPVTARGVCWSVNASPTINDSKTSDGTGVGSFTSSITGLNPNTSYYVRAYATNSIGTAYGQPVAFKTSFAMPAALVGSWREVNSMISGCTDTSHNTALMSCLSCQVFVFTEPNTFDAYLDGSHNVDAVKLDFIKADTYAFVGSPLPRDEYTFVISGNTLTISATTSVHPANCRMVSTLTRL